MNLLQFFLSTMKPIIMTIHKTKQSFIRLNFSTAINKNPSFHQALIGPQPWISYSAYILVYTIYTFNHSLFRHFAILMTRVIRKHYNGSCDTSSRAGPKAQHGKRHLQRTNAYIFLALPFFVWIGEGSRTAVMNSWRINPYESIQLRGLGLWFITGVRWAHFSGRERVWWKPKGCVFREFDFSCWLVRDRSIVR